MNLLRGALSFLGSAVLLWAGGFCGLLCLISAFDLSVDTVRLQALGALTCAVVALLWSLPKFRFVPLTLCLGFISVLIIHDTQAALDGRYSPLVSGGATVGSQIVMAYRDIFPALSPSYPLAVLTQEETTLYSTWFLLAVLLLLTLYLGWASIRRRSVWLTVLGTAPLPALGLMIGRLPAAPFLLGLLVCWLTLLLARAGTRREDRWAFTKVTLLLLPLSAAFLSGILLLLPRESDTLRPESVTEFRSLLGDRLIGVVTDAADMLEGQGFSITLGSIADQSTQMSFSQIGTLTQSTDTLFSITATSSQPLYLRRLSMGVYTGSGWSQCSDETGQALETAALNSGLWAVGSASSAVQAELWAAMLSSSSDAVPNLLSGYDALTVYGSDSPFVYTTYQALPSQMGYQELQAGLSIPDIVTSEDSYCQFQSDTGAEQYTVYYAAPDTEPASTQASVASGSTYSELVNQNDTDYSACSQEELSALNGLLASVDFSGVENSAAPRVEAAKRIVSALQAVTQYDLHVKTASHDFALNFLTTGKGYCVHYATTAALLFRIYGIPARYVTGFLVNPGDAKETGVIPVTGKNAHAWVEIFIEGYGWYPIEATPAASLEATAGTGTTAASEQDSAQTQAAGAESQTETQTGSTQAQPSPTAADEAQGEGKTTATQTASRLLPLWIAAALLTVGVLPVRRRVILRARVKKTHGSDANRNAVALWDYFQALSRRYPVALPEVCERLAKKAAFSQHRLTQEEVQTLLTAARNAAEQVQEGLNAWGRFVFRFLYVLDWLDSVDP